MSPIVSMVNVPVGFQPMGACDKAKLTLTGFKNGKIDEDGNTPIRIELTVEEPEEHAGHKVFLNHGTSAAALPFLKETMVYFGTDPAELDGAIDTDEILKECIGRSAYAKISVREWQGKKYDNVTLIGDDSWEG